MLPCLGNLPSPLFRPSRRLPRARAPVLHRHAPGLLPPDVQHHPHGAPWDVGTSTPMGAPSASFGDFLLNWSNEQTNCDDDVAIRLHLREIPFPSPRLSGSRVYFCGLRDQSLPRLPRGEGSDVPREGQCPGVSIGQFAVIPLWGVPGPSRTGGRDSHLSPFVLIRDS